MEELDEMSLFIRQQDAKTKVIEPFFNNLVYNEKPFDEINIKYKNYKKSIIENFVVTYYNIHTLHEEEEAPYITHSSNAKSKLPLFHIYDGYLSSEYGSNGTMTNECIHMMKESFNTLNTEQEYSLKLFAHTFDASYEYTFLKIYNFMLGDNNDIKYLFFGPPKHATALLFNKTDNFIQITYINTGEGIVAGLDEKEHILIKNNIFYANLFKNIYIPRNNKIINAFMHYIKPFVLYRYLYSDISSKDRFDLFMNGIFYNFNIYIDSVMMDIDMENEYYPISTNGNIEVLTEPEFFNIFNTETKNINFFYNDFFENIIKVKKTLPYYKLLNILFSTTTQEKINKLFPEIIPHIISHEKTMKERYVNFLHEWEKPRTLYPSINSHNYLKLAIDTFKNTLDKDNNLFFELQKSGTCVYKSCISTLFLYHHLKHYDISFTKLYEEFTQSLFYLLNQNMMNHDIICTNTPNTFLIYNKLLSDDVTWNKSKPIDIIKELNKIELNDIIVSEGNNIYIECVELDKLNLFVERIRNRDESVKSQIIETYKFNEYNEHRQKEKELILLAILWEYYFNFDKWNKTFSDMKIPELDYYLFTSMKVRITLNLDELIWINKINYRYIYNTSDNFYFNKMCNEFELWKHISKKYDDDIEILSKYDMHIIHIEPLLYTQYYDYRNILNISNTNIFHSPSKGENIFYLFILNNIIDIINPNIEGFEFISRYTKNIISYPIDMTNMLSHILTVFKQNMDDYFEHIPINVFVYIKTFLCFYQYFDLFDRYKIVKNIIKTLSKIEINENNISVKKIDIFVDAILNLINILSTKYILSNNIINTEIYNTNYIKNTKLTEVKVQITYEYYHTFINKLYEQFENKKDVTSNEQIDDIIANIVNIFQFNVIDENVKLNSEDKSITYKYGDRIISSKYIDITSYYSFCPLIQYLYISSVDNRIFVTDEHLIMIINKLKYTESFLKNNVVFIFKITKIANKIELNYNDIMINGKLYDYTDDVKTYPFLINAPSNCLNFVGNHNNKFKWISICHYKKSSNYLENAVIEVKKEKYYYAEFNIKINMLTPYYDEINKQYINTIRKYKHGEWLFKGVEPSENSIETKPIIYTPIAFDNIIELFEKGRDAVITVVTNILNSTLSTGKKLSFIEWLNRDNAFITGNSFECTTECLYKPKDINKIIDALILLRTKIINEIIYDADNIMLFITYNYKILSLLLQVNNIIENMISLNKILDNCKSFSCHDIFEITQMFDMRDNSMDIYEIIIEIIFGKVIRQEQLNRYRDMLNNYKTKTRAVYQFMMGKGKSSIITPLLYYNLFNMKETVYIVVPPHLKKQTIATYNDFSLYFNNMPSVLTDDQLKLQFLKNEYNDKAIYLFDEFDSMYNPQQSNFNIIINTKNTFDMNRLNRIYMLVYLYMYNKTIFKYEPYSLEEDVYNIITNEKFIKNVNFGMSKSNKSLRTCIPYIRQDSPSEGSSFSSPMITLVLTIKYFYDNKYFTIYNEDMDKIINVNKNLFTKILDKNNVIIPNIHKMTIFDIHKAVKKIYTKYTIDNEIFGEYLKIIVGEITISDKIMNCSFIDIIQMPCVWQIGYSGTTNMIMEVPKLTDNILQHYNTEINKDPDEEHNVFTALVRTKDIIKFNDIDLDKCDAFITANPKGFDQLFSDITINNDVVIDACAIFKDYDNENVAKELYKRTQRPVIYLTKDDDMMIYNDEPMPFSYSNSMNAMYYFSQRHIVGIDIMNQPSTLRGIVIIDDNNNYTQVAQAIYRMRKLNKGQQIKICYKGTNYDNSIDIYHKLLKVKEEEVKRNNEPLLYLQYLKYYYRSTVSEKDKIRRNKYYEESDLSPLYDVVDNITLKEIATNPSRLKEIILKRLFKNIFNMYEVNESFIETNLEQIKLCYKHIISLPQVKLLELLFNVNSYSVNTNVNSIIEQNKETIMNISQEAQRIASLSLDTGIIDIRFPNIKNTFFIYNPFYSGTEERKISAYQDFIYRYQPIINRQYKIFMPLNNIFFSIIPKNDEMHNMTQLAKFFIVMIDGSTFIIEPSTMISKYINILPIYSLTGYIMNKNVFPIVPNKIDVDNILNFRIYSDLEKPKSFHSISENSLQNDRGKNEYIGRPIEEKPCIDFSLLFNINNKDVNMIEMDSTSFSMYSLVYTAILFGLTNITTVKPHINEIIKENFGMIFMHFPFNKIIAQADSIYIHYINEYYKTIPNTCHLYNFQQNMSKQIMKTTCATS